jgi:L,D-transpeptidase ErfK/SrfK
MGSTLRRWAEALTVPLALLVIPAGAETFSLPPADVDLVGSLGWGRVESGDTLLDVARRHDIGQEEILLANPGLDRWLPPAGSRVLLPSRYILPSAERKGLVLNLPEMRLYWFDPNAVPPRLATYPVSVGRMDWKTPLGTTRIQAKQRDPWWHPPESVKEEAAAEGRQVPDAVPPGPENPLGSHALRLALPGYLIHGTNKPFGVGMRVTHGCIRLDPEDIAELFAQVPTGAQVQIVNQPVKLGWVGELLFIEIHPPLEEDQIPRQRLLRRTLEQIYTVLEDRPVRLDGSALREATRTQTGIPMLISQPPTESPQSGNNTQQGLEQH